MHVGEIVIFCALMASGRTLDFSVAGSSEDGLRIKALSAPPTCTLGNEAVT